MTHPDFPEHRSTASFDPRLFERAKCGDIGAVLTKCKKMCIICQHLAAGTP